MLKKEGKAYQLSSLLAPLLLFKRDKIRSEVKN